MFFFRNDSFGEAFGRKPYQTRSWGLCKFSIAKFASVFFVSSLPVFSSFQGGATREAGACRIWFPVAAEHVDQQLRGNDAEDMFSSFLSCGGCGFKHTNFRVHWRCSGASVWWFHPEQRVRDQDVTGKEQDLQFSKWFVTVVCSIIYTWKNPY